MTFGKEFTTAVEQKQIAQQDAERAKFVVEKAEQERQAAVIRAEGEAEAAQTISAALNRAGDAFVQFRKIEASRDIGGSFLLTWAGRRAPRRALGRPERGRGAHPFHLYTRLELTLTAASTLSQARNVQYVPSSSGNMLLQVPPQQ